MTIPILATKAAQKNIDELFSNGGTDRTSYYAFVHKLIAGEGLEFKGRGFYGIDLGLNAYRALFTFDENNNPVFFYVGDHVGYKKYCTEILTNPKTLKNAVLGKSISPITLEDKGNVKNFTLEEVNDNLRNHLRRLGMLGGKPDAPKVDVDPGGSGKPGKVGGKSRRGGGAGRVAAAVASAAILAGGLASSHDAEAAGFDGEQLVSAGKELVMGFIPFTGSLDAAEHARFVEAIASFVGDCGPVGVALGEALRPLLVAAGFDVDPGTIGDALKRLRTDLQSDSRFLQMKDMMQDIPALSREDLRARNVPSGAVYDVALLKYQAQQEVLRSQNILNGRELDELSETELIRYQTCLNNTQRMAREAQKIWEKEIAKKLGPDHVYGNINPVDALRVQIQENLNRQTKVTDYGPDTRTALNENLQDVSGTLPVTVQDPLMTAQYASIWSPNSTA